MTHPLAAGRPGVRSAAPSGARSSHDPDRRSARRRLRGWAVVALAAALGGCEALPLGPGLDDAPDGSAEQEFVSLVNAHRASLGCPGLAPDGRVAEVAAGHSRDMALRGFFAHTTPDGVDPWQRLARAGVTYGTAGENIAHGISSGRQAFRMWMDSAPHRRNIENCAFTHHGVGTFEGRWTHVFIRPL